MSDTPEWDKVVRALRLARQGLPKIMREVLTYANALIGQEATGTFMRNYIGPIPPRSRNTTNKLRIVTGRLARSLLGSRHAATAMTPEAITKIHLLSKTHARLTKGTKVPYAAVHEYGFDGTVHVRAHTRRSASGSYTVRAHARRYRVRRRPFLNPALTRSMRSIRAFAAERLTTWLIATANRL